MTDNDQVANVQFSETDNHPTTIISKDETITQIHTWNGKLVTQSKLVFLSISALPAKWRLSRERCYSLQSSDTAWRWPHHQIALDKRNLRLGTRHTPLPSATRTCQFPFNSSLFLWMSLKFKRLTRRCSRPTAPDQLPLTFDPLFCPSNDRTL